MLLRNTKQSKVGEQCSMASSQLITIILSLERPIWVAISIAPEEIHILAPLHVTYNQPHLDITFSKHKVLLARITKMSDSGANFKHRE